jgi:putative ABC transport system permease protein
VIVLSEPFWRNQLHSNEKIVGSTLDLSGKPYVIVGVLPSSFRFWYARPPDFYVPLGLLASDPNFNSRTGHGSVRVLGRLLPGVTPKQAIADMKSVAARLAAQYPVTNSGDSVAMIPLTERYFGQARPILLLLMLSVLVVLLVACANVSNLLLTRGADREREFAIRSALGARGYRIFQQSLGESLCLAVLGGGAGVVIAYSALPLLLRLAPNQVPRLAETTISTPVLAFTCAISVLVAIVCGALPAWAASRIAPEQSLKTQSGMSSRGRGRQRMRVALLVGGIAVTIVLTAATGLMLDSLRVALSADPGFEPDHLLTLDIVLSGDKYRPDAAKQAFFSAAEEHVRALPGVKDVGSACAPPVTGECGDYFYSIPGRVDADSEQLPVSLFNFADETYFRAAGIRMISGRAFSAADTANSPPVVIVNELFARKWWPNGDAVGHYVRSGGRGEPHKLLQIVGVAQTVKQWGLDVDPSPEIWIPVTQRPSQAMVLLVRTAGDPASLSAAAENAVHTVDKEVPVRIHTMDALIGDTLQQRRFLTLLLSIFSGLAIFLAGLGIFGVAAYSVASRRAEIGLRIALGAVPGMVKRWISVQTLRRVGAGCAIGIVAALLSLRLMRDLLYGVSPLNPLVLVATCALLLAVAGIAAWIPARRAAAVDPMETLRAE